MDELPYTEQEHKPIIINILNTESDLEDVFNPSEQINLLKGRQFETINNKVNIIDSTSTYDQYPTIDAARSALCTTDPLYIEMLENGYVGFKLTGTITKNISYSTDKINWTNTTISTISGTGNLISVSNGQKIYFKSSDTTDMRVDSSNRAEFVVKTSNAIDGTNASYNVGGILASLFNNQAAGITQNLFRESKVINAKDLDVSYNNTACTCRFMFYGCSSLISAPVLYAQILPENAYYNMFQNCTSLTTAPDLPAETLSIWCYYMMFKGCTALTDMPMISAKILANYCCMQMFEGCTSLQTAQPLLAPVMANYCYMSMFLNCTSLKELPLLPSTELADYCYYGMFQNDSNIKLSATQTTPYLTLYKVPSTPVFYYDTLWNTNMITAPPSEATVANTLIVAKEPISFPTAAYELPGTTSFNGSSNYIDTGIRLCDSDKSFTLFVDFQYNGKSQYMATAHGAHEASPYPGVEIQLNSNQDKFYLYYYGGREIAAYDTNRHRAMITHTAGTTNASMMYFDDISQAGPASVAYTNITENLLLGCYQTTGGSKGRYLNGTIYDARIYNEVLSATQIEYLMSGGSWTIKGSTLSGLTFSSNSTDYDSMYCDNTGNLYYGASGINTKVYDVSTGWVSDAYKSLIVPSDKSLFEDLFVNQGDAQNLFDPTQTSDGQYINASGRYAAGSESRLSGYIPVISGHSYTWTGISGKTGTNNKRVAGCSSNLATSYTMINSVAVTGQNVAFTNDFTVPSGITYVRLSFNIQDTDIILVDNDAISTGAAWRTFKEKNLTIVYGWSAKEQSLSMPFKSNSTDYSTFNVDATGNILYDTTIAYDASSGWTNNNYKTIRTTFQTSLVFVGADTWLPFYTTNKISVIGPTTITVPTGALGTMFTNTGGTFTGTPTINKAYFTDADIVPNWYDSLSPGGINYGSSNG